MKMRWLGTVALVGALTGCGGNGDLAGDKDAVEDAAQEQADRFASEDFAGAYDMWIDSAKELMTRDEYVEFAKTCDLGGVPLGAEFVRFEGADETTAVVRIGLGEFTNSYQMKLEDGAWSWVPSDESLAAYSHDVDATVEAAKKAGSCD